MPSSTGEKNIAKFQFVQNCFEGHIEVLGRLFYTCVLDYSFNICGYKTLFVNQGKCINVHNFHLMIT